MTTFKRALGVCYYPEHWPEERWPGDAARMAELGLTWVRVGEFAWSRIEPEPGRFEFGWLDRAIEALGNAGLKVVLGTPTATPPRWMLKRHPGILALDAEGRPRGFGSRRHYCFSHPGYREECAAIVERLAERYGRNPFVAAWQTDNEFGCHGTTLSYSAAATEAFRDWLSQRYQSTDALNRVWGNVFWSMEYGSFDQIDLPNLTVTEANPAHVMDFRRFASAQVVSFNRLQAEIIRRYSDAPIAHNFMGREVAFDHHAVGADLDVAAWDSYPLGFLADRAGASEERQLRYLRQGDPDFQAFHHDLYRAVGRGRWWVMEQQPGPVNWAPHNPEPLPGMVRLWSWEAFAHGAEAVCYFRWRQAHFAQEQMHAGLLRPDGAAAPGLEEAARVARELARMPEDGVAAARVALVFDYQSCWAWQIQPQGQGFDHFALVFEFYQSLRRLGLNVDVVPPDSEDLSGYALVLAPAVMSLPPAFLKAIENSEAIILLGPRTNAKTPNFAIPSPLPPNLPGLDAVVARVETLPPGAEVALEQGGAFRTWVERLEGDAEVLERTCDGRSALVASGNTRYLAGWPDRAALDRLLQGLCAEANLPVERVPEGVRRRDTATRTFYFNHGPDPAQHAGLTLEPAGVAWFDK